MVTFGIVDDNIGAFAVLSKLKNALPANYLCVLSQKFPSDNASLADYGRKTCDKLLNAGCDVVVLSGIALSACCGRSLSSCGLPVFYCEAPVLHAATYTASNVLVAGRKTSRRSDPQNVILCDMPDFCTLANAGNERNVVDYISATCEKYCGNFDCIALAHSSMNLYKRCFKRVFPNVQIFDSVDGVARRIRKKYKKYCKEEGFVKVTDDAFVDISQNFADFIE